MKALEKMKHSHLATALTSLLLLFLCLPSAIAYNQVRGYEDVVSAYIYLLSKNTRWPNEDSIKQFNIVLLEEGNRISETLKRMAGDLLINGIPIKVTHVSDIASLNRHGIQVLYVSRKYSHKLETILEAIGPEEPVLVISNEAQDRAHIMINLYRDRKNRIRIQINQENISARGLKVNRKIVLTGEEEVGVSKLFDASIEKMKEQEKRFEKLRSLNLELARQVRDFTSRIADLKKEIETKNRELDQATARLSRMEKRIDAQESLLAKAREEISQKQEEIEKKEQELHALKQEYTRQKEKFRTQLSKLHQQKELISKRAEILSRQQRNIRALDRKIADQEKRLREQEQTMRRQNIMIKKQSTTLSLLLLVVFLLLAFAVYVWHSKKAYERLNKALARAKNDAEYANRSKTAFLANMSHELRTPLNAILGFSELLLNEKGIASAYRETIKIIYKSGAFLLMLLDDVLDLARVEAGKINIEKRPLDIRSLCRDAVAMIKDRAAEKGVEIKIVEQDRIPGCIRGDSSRIRQVILNYLTNAVKYAPSGEIILEISTKDNILHISVTDQGPGIAPEEIEKIFEPFVQTGEASDKTGTGLGLAITRQIVQAMGGRTGAESIPNNGSRFWAEIPFEECDPEEIEEKEPRTSAHVTGLHPSCRHYRILIAEDRKENRLLLKDILSRLGLNIREAKNGKEAVEIFRQWRPDFIWMDMRMPEMNGDEAARIIRTMPGGDKVVIVAISAGAFAEERRRAADSGINDFVAKPVTASQIYSCMQKYLDLRFIHGPDMETATDHKKGDTGESAPRGSQELAQRLETLSPELVKEIYRVAKLLNLEEMEDVLKKVELQDSVLATLLRQLCIEIRYDVIIKAAASVIEKKE